MVDDFVQHQAQKSAERVCQNIVHIAVSQPEDELTALDDGREHHADTRDLSGQCYGSMLLKLPADLDEAKQAAAYMRAQPGITVEEVTGE